MVINQTTQQNNRPTVAPQQATVEQRHENSPQMYKGESDIDQTEISNINQQVDNFIKEVKRLIKKLTKKGGFENEINQLNQAIMELERIKSVINSGADNDDKREAINDFHQGRPWEVMQAVQLKFELPGRVAEFSKSLDRLKKIINNSSMKKVAQSLGLDMEKVRTLITEMTTGLQAVQGYLQSGDYEDAHEEMQGLYENDYNPNNMEGALQRLRGVAGMWRGVKDQNVLAQIKSKLQDAVNAFNSGEYDDVHQLMNNAENQIRNIMNNNNKKNATASLLGRILSR